MATRSRKIEYVGKSDTGGSVFKVAKLTDKSKHVAKAPHEWVVVQNGEKLRGPFPTEAAAQAECDRISDRDDEHDEDDYWVEDWGSAAE